MRAGCNGVIEHVAFVHRDSMVFDCAKAAGAGMLESHPVGHTAPVVIF
jgi:hypothetical protein